MSSHAASHAPVGGRLMTSGYRMLLLVAAVGAGTILYRLLFGIGSVSNLNAGHPWGLWIAIDVVVGTALGCGGLAMALLVYIFNKGRYHPLVRPAVLTSLLGYGLAVIAVAVDLGRYWGLWKVPIFFWRWTGSPQLEVALCVSAYVLVLLLEFSPAILEKWKDTGSAALRSFATRFLGFMDKALLWILALGILLPMMHQSSLGTMMLLPASKLHPLWHTPWLPLLFLVNAVMMGFGMVVMESHLSSRYFRRPAETVMLGRIARVAMWVTVGWLALRVFSIVVQGKIPLLATGMGLWYVVELGLHVAAIVFLASEAARMRPGSQFRAAMLLVVAGALFRVNTYVIAFQPGANWSYFPSVPELLITFGIISAEVALYIFVVRTFPVLAAHPKSA